MIPGPLVPDLTDPRGPRVGGPGKERSRARLITAAGVGLVACSVIALAVWAIFLSPLGFTRYSLADQDRTFTIHKAGTYVLYLEGPGESAAALPPAIDVNTAGLSGQHVDVRVLGTQGQASAPDAYHLGSFEGRGLAVLTADHAGTFVIHVQPAPADQVDPTQQRVVTTGTLAIGRGWSRSWWAGLGGLVALAGVPLIVGLGLLVVGWRQRDVR